MILGDLLKKIGIRIDALTICTPFFEVAISQSQNDKIASWKMYVELITRVSTQYLPDNHGVEKAALESIYKLFEITRDILKEHGREAETFSMLAICMLNLGLRPFTSKWHRLFNNDSLTKETYAEFRRELYNLQLTISKFTALFLQMANVETYEALDFDSIDKFVNALNNNSLLGTNPYVEVENS